MKRIIGFMMMMVMIMTMLKPMDVLAADNTTSAEIPYWGDSEYKNLTRPTQEWSDLFKATILFDPKNITAKANNSSITVNTLCNTSVYLVHLEWSTDKEFRYGEDKYYRNKDYKAPVLVQIKSQTKVNYKKYTYSSKSEMIITQRKTQLYKKTIFHPNDDSAVLYANQKVVDNIRKRKDFSFKKSFQIPRVYDCKDGYFVRITYLYISAIDGKRYCSRPVVVRVK